MSPGAALRLPFFLAIATTVKIDRANADHRTRTAAMEPGPISESPERVERLIDAVQRLSMTATLEDIQSVVRTEARAIAGADGATFVLRDGDDCHYADED